MNGAHDLGGMHGFGAVNPELDEPVFHEEWERRAFALTLASGFQGKWNIDMSRFAREQMPPGDYLQTSYYEHWLFGLERLLVEHELISPDELRSASARSVLPPARAASVDEVLVVIAKGGDCRVDSSISSTFSVGEKVRAKNINPTGHTRLPRYARGRSGRIAEDYGVFIFPDANAAGNGPAGQHLYSVKFMATELWGEASCRSDSVYLDLWDDYLEQDHA